MGSVHARGDTFLTFGLKALTETNTSRLATGHTPAFWDIITLMMEEVRTSETSVYSNDITWCYPRRLSSSYSPP
jgi:hypothetical protein